MSEYDQAAELQITRVFNAPRELVFKAWTEPERLARWWSPRGYSVRVAAFDLRPGGVFHYCQTAPNGQEQWGKFVYREIVAPERLVYVNSFADPQGNTVRAPFSADWPLEIMNILTFSEQGGKTTLLMRGGPINPTDAERATFAGMREAVQGGFSGTLAQLDEYLAETQP